VSLRRRVVDRLRPGARGAVDRRAVVRAQAAYFVVSGLWPIFHLASFMAVTGPKREGWLVQTFGALITGTGLVLAAGPADRSATRLAVVSALTLAAADTWFVARGRIRPVYLGDAALELAFVAGILATRSERSSGRHAPPAAP